MIQIKQLVSGLNKANKSSVLDEHVLNTVFEKFWPDLEGKVSAILAAEGLSVTSSADIRSDRDIMEEILDLSRSLAIQKSGGFKQYKDLNQLISNFMISFYGVFEVDWEYTKINLEDSEILINTNGTFINPNVSDESNNWANRGNLLSAYRELVEYIDMHKIDIETGSNFQKINKFWSD